MSGRSIAAPIRRTVDRDGLTVVMASHDPVLLAIADEVFELRDGRLVPRAVSESDQ
jgi:putative ABC transport system ATP-binding protein